MSGGADGPLGRLAMIMLGVSDLDRSIAFYRDTLALRVRGQSDGLAFIEAGDVALALSVPLWQSRGESSGATEVVFAVADVQDAYERLAARGVTFIELPRPVTATDWAANFADPDGHVLSLFGPSRERGSKSRSA